MLDFVAIVVVVCSQLVMTGLCVKEVRFVMAVFKIYMLCVEVGLRQLLAEPYLRKAPKPYLVVNTRLITLSCCSPESTQLPSFLISQIP